MSSKYSSLRNTADKTSIKKMRIKTKEFNETFIFSGLATLNTEILLQIGQKAKLFLNRDYLLVKHVVQPSPIGFIHVL